MIIKKIGLEITLILFVFGFLMGCATTTPIQYTDNSSRQFIILGEVTHQSKSFWGYSDLLRAAKRRYPECDYVIDIMIDKKVMSFIWLPIPSQTIYLMRGTAIKYVE